MTVIALDSYLHDGLLGPNDEATTAIFRRLREEVSWATMMHKGGEVPRLVAIQHGRGPVVESVPVYRHPIDQEPPATTFSPTVDRIRRVIEQKCDLHLNHCLIQLYRSGQDFIGEHSDKTLDILRGTPIVNYSAGATRQLILQPKRDIRGKRGAKIRVELAHDSLFVLGWETNMQMTHSIRQDKRALAEKRPDELLEEGQRISLTFRCIATFRIDVRGVYRVFGQGARCKSLEELLDAEQSAAKEDHAQQEQLLLAAFAAENRQADFDWDQNYGQGFDIITVNFSD